MMSSVWHFFVIIATVGTLVALVVFLINSRRRAHPDRQEDGTTGHTFDGIQELDNPLPAWWLWMFFASIVFAALYLVAYPGLGNTEGVLGWSSAGQVAEDAVAYDKRFEPYYAALAGRELAVLHGDPEARQVGRRLFLNRCATCHGSAAKGAEGFPNLTDEEWIWGRGYDAVQTAILRGRQAAMPGWLTALGEDGVKATVAYVQSLSAPGAVDASLAETGKQHYGTYCVACHGPEGKGNPLLGAPNIANDIWLYGGSEAAVYESIANGRNGMMPPRAEGLNEHQVRLLAAYVSQLDES